ncbi:AzlD domain-containing protein [Streptococcus parasanguinis]|uniref:branched-chain amino acid transporter permease n=1 Tax=Streptococcus parasanguinis TaxID=1318 RepID=UPI00352C35DA
MTFFQQLITIGMVILGTVLTRFVPFLVFPSQEKTPAYILYLGRVLTPAIFGLLVIFSIKDTQWMVVSDLVPKLVAILLVILLHKWKKNMLLSVVGGTLFYIALIHLVY